MDVYTAKRKNQVHAWYHSYSGGRWERILKFGGGSEASLGHVRSNGRFGWSLGHGYLSFLLLITSPGIGSLIIYLCSSNVCNYWSHASKIWRRVEITCRVTEGSSFPQLHAHLPNDRRSITCLRWRTLTVCLFQLSSLTLTVDDDFIYEDEEEEEPDIDVENGYYNAKGTFPVSQCTNSQLSKRKIRRALWMNFAPLSKQKRQQREKETGTLPLLTSLRNTLFLV